MYFKVTAKCGHVGRRQYYKGEFFISAESAKQAAGIIRNAPRVKHDHKDAILDVTVISYEDYLIGRQSFELNPYFKCTNKREQGQFILDIFSDIFEEGDRRLNKSNEDKKALISLKRKLERKRNKYQNAIEA